MQNAEGLTPPTFQVEVHREPDGSYWVEAPGLPGLMTQGDTMQELEENLQEAFEGWMLSSDPELAAKLGIVATPPRLQLVEEGTMILTSGNKGRLQAAA